MKFGKLLIGSVLLLGPSAFAAPLTFDEPVVAAAPEQFQVTQKTEVPNTTLQPGSYSIRIVDHLRDRVILQVAGKNHVASTFIAIPASTMANAPIGPILYGGGAKGKAALKGFAFPGGLAVEFVYPKADAVSIAQANDARVMAIDPASENRVAAPKLSQTDMEMITLWMLEPSRVGPNDAKASAISASKYQAPPAAAAPAPVEIAQAESPAAPASDNAYANTSRSTSAPSVATPRPARRSRPVQMAQNDVPPPPPARTHTRPAGVTALPHTASALPMVWLGALLSLMLGGLLSLRRLAFRA